MEVKYHFDQNFFAVSFESVLVSLESIFATVINAGKQLGREYLPEVIR